MQPEWGNMTETLLQRASGFMHKDVYLSTDELQGLSD